MAIWDFRQLQQNIDSHSFPDLALLFGDESYLVSESLKLIRNHIVVGDLSDFNYDQFFAGADSSAKVADTAETLPMMSSRRLVIFRDVDKLKDKDWDSLYPLIEEPLSSTCLVLVATKVDKRKKYYKACQKMGQIIEMRKPYENQIPAWIDYIAYNHQLKLDKNAILVLHELVGSQLVDLNSEMKKLSQYLGDNHQVTEKEVLKVVSKVRMDSVFDLTEAIGKKDRASALTFLANLLDHGQNELAAIALVLRHLRVLGSLKDGLSQGLKGAKLCAKVGVPSYFLQKYLYQTEKWSSLQIANTIKALHETDKALKSSPVSSHIWLENFILKTCQ